MVRNLAKLTLNLTVQTIKSDIAQRLKNACGS